jgi:hypothetical protein
MRLALAEKVRESRDALARFPLWITTGSQRDFDEWALGREPSHAEKVERIAHMREKTR